MDFDAIKEGENIVVKTPKKWKEFLSKFKDGSVLVLKVARKRSKRTSLQNNAMHLWFKLMADELNASGNNVQVVLKKRMEVDWSPELVKELLWRAMQQKVLGKKSTTELDKQMDIDAVYEHLNRFIGENFGIHVPFPFDEEREREKHYL